MKWVSMDEIEKRSPETAKIIKEICEKYSITIPKLGIINDKNPSAFTYGAGKWNSRIIVSEGIFAYLNDKEIASVYAHELWHVKNNDFIVMTIASTILQLIYQIYRYLIKVKETGKKKWWAKMIALVAYVFYIIWQYILLYLSRTREYYADRFSAEHTDANTLASALIKIAMWILATPENNELIESTQHMSIVNIKLSENLWLAYYNATTFNSQDLLNRAIVYDLKNPWAQLFELSSTHPLNGKRVRALMQYTPTPLFNIDEILKSVFINKEKLWKGFFLDALMYYLPFIAPILSFIFIWYYKVDSWRILSCILGSFAIWLGLHNLYKYSMSKVGKTTIVECMWDIYASPIRGKFVELEWDVIGKWVPGFIFTEDMMLQDKTGLIYVDYQAPIPLIWNIYFALSKLEKMIWKHITASWWFFRWTSSMFIPNLITYDDGKIKSYQQRYGIIIPLLILIVAIYFIPKVV